MTQNPSKGGKKAGMGGYHDNKFYFTSFFSAIKKNEKHLYSAAKNLYTGAEVHEDQG